ncbi:hypothetical protein [Ornithinibacillus caprae]|nr:hypothetical protein [Ornithinibacillus caprae]
MRELVGECEKCGKEVYCENGFLNGVHESGELFCQECSSEANSSSI